MSAARVLGLLVALVACSRSPSEPAPAASTAPATGAATGTGNAPALAGRCIKETPETPPPAAGPAAKCPVDPDGNLPLAHATITVGASAKLDVELARAPAETTRGLMYRTHMPEEQGMLFDLGDRREHAFWMRNTCIPLDMMFIDDDGLIVGILENVPTLNELERTVGCPSVWVLEVNAGWSRRHGVRAGQRVSLPSRPGGNGR